MERLHPVGVGWNSVVGAKDFSRIDFTLKPHAGRWESGTLNVAGITALGASLALLLEIGIDRVAERVLELTDHLCRRLAEQPWPKVFSSRRPGEASGIVSLALSDAAQLKLRVKTCRDQRIVVNQRGGRLRLSPHCYNSLEELDRAVEVLRSPP